MHHFDPTMWVVSANTQFATVRFLSFLSLFVTRTAQVAPLVDFDDLYVV